MPGLTDQLQQELAKYQQALKQDPNSQAFVPLADAYRRLGKLEDAVQVCRHGLQKHPNHPQAQLLLAMLYYQGGKLKEAFQALAPVLKAQPNNVTAVKVLGKIRQAWGQNDEALKCFQTVLKLAPQDKDALASINQLRQGGGAQAAAPGAMPQTATMAEICIQQGKYKEALAIYQQLAKGEPNNQIYHQKLLWLQSQTGTAVPGGKALRLIGKLETWLNLIQRKRRR